MIWLTNQWWVLVGRFKFEGSAVFAIHSTHRHCSECLLRDLLEKRIFKWPGNVFRKVWEGNWAWFQRVIGNPILVWMDPADRMCCPCGLPCGYPIQRKNLGKLIRTLCSRRSIVCLIFSKGTYLRPDLLPPKNKQNKTNITSRTLICQESSEHHGGNDHFKYILHTVSPGKLNVLGWVPQKQTLRLICIKVIY